MVVVVVAVIVVAAAAAAAVVVAVDFRPPRPHRLAVAVMVHVGGTGPEILVVVVDVAVHTHPVRWSRSVPHCNHAVASWCVQCRKMKMTGAFGIREITTLTPPKVATFLLRSLFALEWI